MPSSFSYGTFANYSPRGTSEFSQRSRVICDNIKAGRVSQIDKAVKRLGEDEARVLSDFLNGNVTLVPVPRSAPMVEGAVWPPLLIATELAKAGYGREVRPLLERVSAVRKSSTSAPDNRPLIHDHMASIRVRNELIAPEHITIIDDVLTMGRTSFACAQLLKERFPDAEIRIFAILRTQGRQPEIERIFDPATGTVTGYSSGKAFRDP